MISLNFTGGIRERAEKRLTSRLGGVDLSVVDFKVRADDPQLGAVTMRLDADVTPSPAEHAHDYLPKGRGSSTRCISMSRWIERSPGDSGPIRLPSMRPVTLINRSLTVYPPQGSVYQLQQPVDFVVPGSSDVVAALQQYPVTVSHNP